ARPFRVDGENRAAERVTDQVPEHGPPDAERLVRGPYNGHGLWLEKDVKRLLPGPKNVGSQFAAGPRWHTHRPLLLCDDGATVYDCRMVARSGQGDGDCGRRRTTSSEDSLGVPTLITHFPRVL